MEKPSEKPNSRKWVEQQVAKPVNTGMRTIEVTVPEQDEALIRAVAAALCSAEPKAVSVREMLKPLVPRAQARTGDELVAFLRASPVAEFDLNFERDASAGRSVDFD